MEIDSEQETVPGTGGIGEEVWVGFWNYALPTDTHIPTHSEPTTACRLCRSEKPSCHIRGTATQPTPESILQSFRACTISFCGTLLMSAFE